MRKLTQIEVRNRLQNLCLDLELLEPYEGRFIKIRVRDNLGIEYLANPDKLFEGKHPSLYSAIDKSKGFAIKARQIHGDKYDYSKSEYIDDGTKLKIKCPKHGYWEQTPSNHLKGAGCPQCGIQRMKLNRAENGWSKTNWINFCENKSNGEPKLYFIHCYNDNEQFIKIGITNRTINGRFWKTNMPYKYQIIRVINGEPGEIYDKEKELQEKLRGFKYIPNIKFHGYTECYSESIKGVIS